jgi:mannose-6-phosphate isomerase-like protein (cupin superfamily)
MIKKINFIVSILILLGIATSALAGEPQVYLKKDLKTWDRSNVANGQGVLSGQFSFTRNDELEDYIIKEIGWLTLLPSASIGLHSHTDNEDVYIIVSGEGVFTDSNGIKTNVSDGDITIARPGDSHALENTGNVPLVFINVQAKNH